MVSFHPYDLGKIKTKVPWRQVSYGGSSWVGRTHVWRSTEGRRSCPRVSWGSFSKYLGSEFGVWFTILSDSGSEGDNFVPLRSVFLITHLPTSLVLTVFIVSRICSFTTPVSIRKEFPRFRDLFVYLISVGKCIMVIAGTQPLFDNSFL